MGRVGVRVEHRLTRDLHPRTRVLSRVPTTRPCPDGVRMGVG